MTGRRARETPGGAAPAGPQQFALPLPARPQAAPARAGEPSSADAPTPPGAAAAAARAAEPEPSVLTVGQLVRAARMTLETRYGDVRVEGELSGLRVSGPGHLYFTLKDRDAQLDCAMFAREAARLKVRPADGLRVVCRGRLTIFEGRGKFQLAVTELAPAGLGALALAFEELKRRLQAEGLFDPARKRPLPFLPRRVGVVTSRQGAVIRDIIHVAHRRARVPILVADTPVQGEGAAAQIGRALERLGRVPDVDVIILARGGGSLEDLWAFNDEALARAIVRAPVPVVSAVGHETDFTIADFAADLRAPTPSAAAELVFPDFAALDLELTQHRQRLLRAQRAGIDRARHALLRLRASFSDPRRLLDRRRQWLDELTTEAAAHVRRALRARREALAGQERRLLAAHPQRRIAGQRQALAALEQRARAALASAFTHRRSELERASGKLDALSPLAVLGRGYSLTRTADGRVLRRAADVAAGDALDITLHEGRVAARALAGTGPAPGSDGPATPTAPGPRARGRRRS